MIVDEVKNTVPTIEDALQFVGRKADTFESLRIKGLGLRLVLMGLAEVQALRLSRLAGMVFRLEKELLDEKTLRNLDPKSLFSLYTLSTRALTESSEFVERTLKTMDWSALETDLLQAHAQSSSPTHGGVDALEAQELLSALARFQAELRDSSKS